MTQIDMPMPECCADCPFASAKLINRIITLACMTQVGRRMYAPDLISRKTRPEWCPLKEQEAVEPKKESDDYPGSWWYICGNCGEVIDWHDMYCRHCGQAVKWK